MSNCPYLIYFLKICRKISSTFCVNKIEYLWKIFFKWEHLMFWYYLWTIPGPWIWKRHRYIWNCQSLLLLKSRLYFIFNKSFMQYYKSQWIVELQYEEAKLLGFKYEKIEPVNFASLDCKYLPYILIRFASFPVIKWSYQLLDIQNSMFTSCYKTWSHKCYHNITKNNSM